VEKLRQRLQASQTGHDERRHQLDMQVQEIEDLKQALTQRSSELERAEQEKKRMSKEHSDVMRTVSSLESDLKRVKRDAETFGRDLRALKAERDELALKRREENGKAERVQNELRSQIRILEEQLEVEMSKRIALQDQMQAHVCGGYVTILTHSQHFSQCAHEPPKSEEGDVARLRLQHNKECKGLLFQIRYLKDKFTRESTFRIELAYQKNYLLAIISHLEKK
jgi:predicted  nucleic acid-binding Zn-ribbon protein